MKLFYTPNSPYARICRIIASQAGLSDRLELVAVKLRTQDNPVIPLSPMGRIPVLVDGNLILSEARHICAYLDEKGSGVPSVAPYSAWQAVADEAETLAFLDAVIVWSREVRREANVQSDFYELMLDWRDAYPGVADWYASYEKLPAVKKTAPSAGAMNPLTR